MGISTKPKDDWCEYDNSEFPAGKTPRVLSVGFEGIVKSDPAYPDAVCRTFVLQQITDQLWQYNEPIPTPDSTYPLTQLIVQYRSNAGTSSIYYIMYIFSSYGIGESWGLFYGGYALPLIMAGINDYTVPGSNHGNGSWQGHWMADADTPNSLASLAVLSGMEASSKDLYEPTISTATAEMYRLARRRDHSCIYTRRSL